MRYWLMKSEPSTYSIDDLRADGRTSWEGVRNYQARNLMRDEFAVGDAILYYHSRSNPPGVVGLAEVVREAWPDPTQFDPTSRDYDPTATRAAPRWVVVDIAFVEKWADIVSLSELKADPALEGMMVTRRGSRLSVQPVCKEHFERVVELGRAKGPVER